ncbi:MAG: phosphatidylserine/phosphatidylglycerophosphate/cardiolipin synthase family protein [Porphyrobacter sp.]|nr:phosphatidylserine/phosphatidylglycerophosphate/cardiolipin synthase family protein [Porphyrobacter sp.]
MVTAPPESPQSGPDYRDPDPVSITAAGHSFTFYPHGQDRLAALIALIESAKASLRVFYYLFDSDGSGTRVRDALIAAAQRGVQVELIVDAFGNDAGAPFFEPLIAAGGTFALFGPRWGTRYLVRNHQKFAIADEGAVMTGGANVSDHYFASPADNGWCDLSVQIEGPVVEQFTRWFGLLREWVAGEAEGRTRRLRALRDIVRAWDGGDGPVRLLVGGPLVRRGHWAWVLRQDLVSATRLDTVSAYFSPPRSFRRLFARIGRRGSARMIMPGKSDIAAAIDMARLLYGKLLRARIRLFEFGPCKLHMKLLVVDDVSYVGSANLDKRSFRINVELMVRIADPEVAAALRKVIDHLEAASEPITPAWYARHSTLLARMRWRIAYWLNLADYRISAAGTR